MFKDMSMFIHEIPRNMLAINLPGKNCSLYISRLINIEKALNKHFSRTKNSPVLEPH